MNSWRSLQSIAALLIVAALLAPPTTAQINTDRISGVVLDSADAIVPGVVIQAINEETGVVTSGVSRETGDYLINFLIPGSYRVEAEKTGF
jgi:hypothetical protein